MTNVYSCPCNVDTYSTIILNFDPRNYVFSYYSLITHGTTTNLWLPLQFHRVLSELELGGMVNSLEFVILYRKFDVKVGGRNDVNYIAFCQMINKYAQTRWTDPTLK